MKSKADRVVRQAVCMGLSVKEALTSIAVGALVMPGFAFAADGDFDGTDVIAKVVTYTAVGVAILGAFALGRWTLKALGVIGGR